MNLAKVQGNVPEMWYIVDLNVRFAIALSITFTSIIAVYLPGATAKCYKIIWLLLFSIWFYYNNKSDEFPINNSFQFLFLLCIATLPLQKWQHCFTWHVCNKNVSIYWHSAKDVSGIIFLSLKQVRSVFYIMAPTCGYQKRVLPTRNIWKYICSQLH